MNNFRVRKPISVEYVLSVLFVVFLAFPFVQIFPGLGYNQPYSLIFALCFFPMAAIRYIKGSVSPYILMLISFFVIGLVMFLIECFPSSNIQEYKYLYSYICFPVVCISALYVLDNHPKMVKIVLTVAAYIWLMTGLIQTVYRPDFLTQFIGLSSDTPFDIVMSGRGVVSLAPEPTHYGFHLLMLGGILSVLRASPITLIICVLQAVLLAKSASAIMVLGIGFLLTIFLSAWRLKISNCLLISTFGLILLVPLFVIYIGPESRIYALSLDFLESPLEILQKDYSLNIRIGGLIASFQHIFDAVFFPFGMSHSTWIASSEEIIANNLWLKDISLVGPPSGVGILLYQAGVFILPSVFVLVFMFFRVKVRNASRVLLLSIPIIIFFQYYISSPTFALAVAVIIQALTMQSAKGTFKDYTLNMRSRMQC